MKISTRNAAQIRAGILLARALMNQAVIQALQSPEGRGGARVGGLTALMAKAFDREEPKARARASAQYTRAWQRSQRVTPIQVRVRRPES